MKNSVWREYQNGVTLLRELERKTGRSDDRPPGRIEPINKPRKEKSEIFDPVQPWRCFWCGKPNPVGAAVCESCGMVRVE